MLSIDDQRFLASLEREYGPQAARDRQLAEQRERELARADQAVASFWPSLRVDPLTLELRDALIDECLREPHIEIIWIGRDRPLTRAVVGNGNARADLSHRAIFIGPICNVRDAAVGWHEAGHIRGGSRSFTLDDERQAWAWAMTNAPFWPAEAIAEMTECLRRYVDCGIDDGSARTIDVVRCEAFVSDESVQRYQRHSDAVLSMRPCSRPGCPSPTSAHSIEGKRLCTDCAIRLMRARTPGLSHRHSMAK
jgi:hypothetical protein